MDSLVRHYPLHQPVPNGARFTVTEVRALRSGQDARVTWSPYWVPASVSHRSGLNDREFLSMLRWAIDTIERYRLDLNELEGAYDLYLADETAQVTTAPAVVLPGPSDRWGRGVGTLICTECGSEFHPDSSPSLDLCWMCEELADAEVDR